MSFDAGLDTILVWLERALTHARLEVAARGTWDWVLFFLPLLLLEIPRYHFPLVGLLVAKALGHPRVDAVRRERFLARKPSVSVVVAGRNEASSIEACIRSLLDQGWPTMEVLVVDDASDDATEQICRRYAREGLIRYVRNESSHGRGGRPAASNLGLALASGEFLLSLDADTTFDRGLIENVLAPFADPRVGVVAGNVLARNRDSNTLTRIQTLEYVTSIDLGKRWSGLFGRTLQASGAIGAFRRRALVEIGGWDPELAEDGDISLRMVKAGYRTAFAPDAVSITDVPESWRVIFKQRTRWDRGGFRVYFAKHHRLLRPSVSGKSFAFGMWGELVFGVVLPLVYPLYLVWLAFQGLALFAFVMATTWAIYTALSFLPLVFLPLISRRVDRVASLIPAAFVSPFYREWLRWAKIRALVLEILHVRYEDSFLPDSAWAHARRF